MRPGRPAAAAPGVAGGASQGGRAGGAGCTWPLPPELARDRPAREPPRGTRPAPGASPACRALGKRRLAAAGSGLPARVARPALCDGRARLGRSRPRPRGCLLPGGRFGSGPRHGRRRGRKARCTTGSGAFSAAAQSSGSTCSLRLVSRRRRRCPRSVGPRLGRRSHERRLDAAPGRSPLRRASAGAPTAPLLPPSLDRDHRDPGTVVAHRQALPGHPGSARARRASARAPGNRHAGRRPRRGNPGRLQRRLRGAARLSRHSASAGAATSSKGWAARSSPSAARSRGFGSSARRRARSPRRS